MNPRSNVSLKATPIRQITQREISELQHLRLEAETLKASLKAKEEIVETFEVAMTEKLERGLSQEAGPLRAVLDVKSVRGRPSWKDAFAQACGAQAVEDVVAGCGFKDKKEVKILARSV